jgi:hypothetical protein
MLAGWLTFGRAARGRPDDRPRFDSGYLLGPPNERPTITGSWSDTR